MKSCRIAVINLTGPSRLMKYWSAFTVFVVGTQLAVIYYTGSRLIDFHSHGAFIHTMDSMALIAASYNVWRLGRQLWRALEDYVAYLCVLAANKRIRETMLRDAPELYKQLDEMECYAPERAQRARAELDEVMRKLKP